MSFRWVMMYLPDWLREGPGIGGPSRTSDLSNVKRIFVKGRVTRLATESFQLEVFVSEPAERVLTVKKYANTPGPTPLRFRPGITNLIHQSSQFINDF